MSGLIVSSTEPSRLKEMAETISTEPETFGADFMWEGWDEQLWGVQRKEINDLMGSLVDGRLGMELQQMQRLDHAILIIEGAPMWTTDGVLMTKYGPDFTRKQYGSLRLTIQMNHGVAVHETSSMTDTIQMIESFREWSSKEEHISLLRRPAMTSEWGSASSQDFRCWLLQSVPGVGPKAAQAIDTALGGSPFQMRVTREELTDVDGIGPKTADAIIAAVTQPKKRTRKKAS